MSELGYQDLETAASMAAGNWRKFQSFGWSGERELEDSQNWAIIYTHNRDSGLLEQSNGAEIEKALEKFTEGDNPDVVFESHGHFACGWVDGFSVRVYSENGVITEAFKAVHELLAKLADYPVLNEEEYSQWEHDATWENLETAIRHAKQDGYSLGDTFVMPEDATEKIWQYLWANTNELENRDDSGGYPSDESLFEACEELDFERIRDDDDDDSPVESV